MKTYLEYMIKIKDLNWDKHFWDNLVSDRFDLTCGQKSNLKNYPFYKLTKKVIDQYPWWNNKIREGFSYFYNTELNMVLVLNSERDPVTCLLLDGFDMSSINKRFGDQGFSFLHY